MTSSSPLLTLIGYCFSIAGAIVFMGVSLGTNCWLVIDQRGVRSNAGLFESCTYGTCFSYAKIQMVYKGRVGLDFSTFETCQGLCITAIVLDALTLFVMGHLIYQVFMMKRELRSRNHGVIVLLMSCTSGFLAIAGGVHFVIHVSTSALYLEMSWYFGYSMYLALASGGLSFGVGTLAVIANVHLHKFQRPQLQSQPQPQHNVQAQVVASTPPVQMMTPVIYVHAPIAQFPHPAGNQPMPMYSYYPHQESVAPPQNVVTDKQPPPYNK